LHQSTEAKIMANLQPGVVCGQVQVDSLLADHTCYSQYHNQVIQTLQDRPSSGCFLCTTFSMSKHHP